MIVVLGCGVGTSLVVDSVSALFSFFVGGGGVSVDLLKSATFQSAFTSPLLISL